MNQHRLLRRSVLIGFVCTFCLMGEAAGDTTIADRRVNVYDWHWDPAILLNLTLCGWLYTRGWIRFKPILVKQQKVSVGHVISFAVGVLVILVCLISPLDALSGQLASAHMVQHMVLMTVAAPLVVLGAPSFICFAGLPPTSASMAAGLRRRFHAIAGETLAQPMVTWTLYAVVMWGWHVPVLYNAALTDRFIHDLQHLSFFIASLLFWRPLLDPYYRSKMNGAAAVFYLFSTTLHATVLGVFMTIAPTPWYSEYLGRTELWGFSGLEDQQLAGLIMWMPACVSYAIVAAWLFAKTLEAENNPSEKFAFDRNASRTIATVAHLDPRH